MKKAIKTEIMNSFFCQSLACFSFEVGVEFGVGVGWLAALLVKGLAFVSPITARKFPGLISMRRNSF